MTRFLNEECNSSMTFHECELAILRNAVDEAEKYQQKKIKGNLDVRKMVDIVEKFLRDEDCICYGGTAINNILPKGSQFYNRDLEIPDYDFYSSTPLDHAKKLADIYADAGYTEVEAKAGMHVGTFKVFVNFIPMADITHIHVDIFNNIKKDAIVLDKIKYAPPNYLRMNMFLELSRPRGDVTRWEKIFKRLTLLNKKYPLTEKHCYLVDFQRNSENVEGTKDLNESLYYITRDFFVKEKCIFFGGYASSLYSKYMSSNQKHMVRTVPDFDVLKQGAKECSDRLKIYLVKNGFKNVVINTHDSVGEIVPKHYEVQVNSNTVSFIYEPIACHNYNELKIQSKTVRVATIDTMLSFYLAFYYSKKKFHSDFQKRLLCMSQFLFLVEQKNRLSHKGLLKRFSIKCYGKQDTLESMRSEKTKKFKDLENKRETEEYEYWFMKYDPLKNKNKRKYSAKKENVKLDKDFYSNNSSKTYGTTRKNKESSRKTKKTVRFSKNTNNSTSRMY